MVVVTAKNSNFNLKYVLALLNSNLFNYIYAKKFKLTKKVFSEIQARSVGELPVKRNEIIEDQIVNLIDEVLERKKTDFYSDILDIEYEINNLIYDIYEISEEDRKNG